MVWSPMRVGEGSQTRTPCNTTQNIPAKGSIAKQIRQCFEAPKGYKLLVADYRQVEMLLFAHFSKDPVMLAAANGGQDFHCMTGATMYGKTYDEMLIAKLKDDKNAEKLQKMGVTDLTMTEEDHSLLFLRSLTKAINFGILYGMGPGKLAAQLGITKEEAKQKIQQYFEAFPTAKEFIDYTHQLVRDGGVIWTLMGRPRRIPEGHKTAKVEDWVRARAQRQAVNSSIQGSAADVVMNAMLRCHQDAELSDLGCRLLLQVHDELVFEVPEQNAERSLEKVRDLMEYKRGGPENLLVDLTVSIHIGDNWAEAK